MRVEEVLVTDKSKLNFLKGLIRVAKADGNIDKNELQYYSQAAITFGLGQDSIIALENAMDNEQDVKVEFETQKEKLFFFTQVIQLCWIDGQYSDDEKNEIRKLQGELSVRKSSIDEIEKWVKDGIEWNNKLNDLLTLE